MIGKKIPKSLEECTRTGSTTYRLVHWAELLEKWGFRVFVLIICFGILAVINDVKEIAEIDESLIFITAVDSTLTWGLYALLTYYGYNVSSLLVSSLASIVHNTGVSAKIAAYNAANAAENTHEESKLKSTEIWICKDCETKNEPGSYFCKVCGKHK